MNKKLVLCASLVALLALPGCSKKSHKRFNDGSSAHNVKGVKLAHNIKELVQNGCDRVYFDLDKFEIRDDSYTSLDSLAAFLKANPSYIVRLEGFCDFNGTRDYNMSLGLNRANTVKKYLISCGIEEHRIEIFSYGRDAVLPEGQGTVTEWFASATGSEKLAAAYGSICDKNRAVRGVISKQAKA